jgi:hypothetical protein
MKETGWCLTRTPPAEVVVLLLDAPGEEARGVVLLAAEARMLGDLDDELRSIDHGGLPARFGRGARGGRGARERTLRLGAATATAALSTLVDRHGPFRTKSFASARAWLGKLDLEDAGFPQM